jgi:hypothetical protein
MFTCVCSLLDLQKQTWRMQTSNCRQKDSKKDGRKAADSDFRIIYIRTIVWLAHKCPHFGHVDSVIKAENHGVGGQLWVSRSEVCLSFPKYPGVSFLWMICYVTHQPHVFASVGMPIHVKWGWCVTKHMHEGLKG